MPYSIRAETGTPYLFVRLYDDYGLDDARDMLRELAETHASLDGMAVICDMRDGNVHVSWQEAFEFAQLFRDHDCAFNGVRWSVIVPALLEYDITGNAGITAVDVPFEYNVSHDPESACLWAGVPVESLDMLDELRFSSDESSLPKCSGSEFETIDLQEWLAMSREAERAEAQVVA